MLGDSFCKILRPPSLNPSPRGFQSPCLGTLFARLGKNLERWENGSFQSPCLGTLFASTINTAWRMLHEMTFNPHAWGLFLQAGGSARAVRSCPATFNPHAWGLFLQVCWMSMQRGQYLGFQSPCLGTLFARPQTRQVQGSTRNFQSPCLGTLFARGGRGMPPARPSSLSIPMLGDSFCKLFFRETTTNALRTLSIPMLGDSFCKTGDVQGILGTQETFNPHAWGLFLQAICWFADGVPTPVTFQSPCLGTLFARRGRGELLLSRRSLFQSPCLGTLFASRLTLT